MTGPPPFYPGVQPVGVDAGGSGGGVSGLVLAEPRGFCVAFDDVTLAENPVWTRLDDPAGPYLSQTFDIQRGRTYELDRTGTGTASETRRDTTGTFDPTNTTSPFSGKLLPLKNAAYGLFNPVTSTWHTIWRGYISEWANDPDPTERTMVVTVTMADGFGILSATEMVPGGSFGDTPPAVSTGNVYYAAEPTTNGVQNRMNRVLDDVGWAGGLRNIFTGRVSLQEKVYAPRSAALSALLDAADADYPTVSNTFMTKEGKVGYRGRLARSNPTDPNYFIDSWSCGDAAAAAASPSTVVPVCPPVTFYTDDEHVYTSAISTPKGIDDADVSLNVVDNTAGIAAYGRRTWSAENLETAGGVGGTTALVETKKYAQHVADSYSTPRTRVGALTFKALSATGVSAAATWALVCGIEIGDLLHLKTTHTGGGGFDTDFFVEGLRYEIRPLKAAHHEVTLTVDVSPRSLYTSAIT